MPPKAKFTREEIIAAAMKIVRKKGVEAVTAREIGNVLGSSARPIFTVFESMDEVHEEVKKAAMAEFEKYAEKALNFTPIFKAFGVQFINFAKEEPKLFQLLYMQENESSVSLDEELKSLGSMLDVCIDSIQRDYDITLDEARILFEQVWIFTFGIGVLCAGKTCHFSDEKIFQLLGREFVSMLQLIKSGKLHLCNIQPEEGSTNEEMENMKEELIK